MGKPLYRMVTEHTPKTLPLRDTVMMVMYGAEIHHNDGKDK